MRHDVEKGKETNVRGRIAGNVDDVGGTSEGGGV